MHNTFDNSQSSNRLESIDIVRGLIMMIMALDHVREFFSYTAFRADDVTQTSVALFFTRWITHICAPTFVFLSGISIYLYHKKDNRYEKTAMFLITRGLWLIAAEMLLISFILTQGYDLTVLEVIWSIGCSMILLSGLILLPRSLQIAMSLAMIVGHHLLPVFMNVTPGNVVFAFLHNFPFVAGEHPVLVAYTIIPWVGVMLLGYAIGPWFLNGPQIRTRLLLRAGIVSLLVFFCCEVPEYLWRPIPLECAGAGRNLHDAFFSKGDEGTAIIFIPFSNIGTSVDPFGLCGQGFREDKTSSDRLRQGAIFLLCHPPGDHKPHVIFVDLLHVWQRS